MEKAYQRKIEALRSRESEAGGHIRRIFDDINHPLEQLSSAMQELEHLCTNIEGTIQSITLEAQNDFYTPPNRIREGAPVVADTELQKDLYVFPDEISDEESPSNAIG